MIARVTLVPTTIFEPGLNSAIVPLAHPKDGDLGIQVLRPLKDTIRVHCRNAAAQTSRSVGCTP